MKRISIMMVPVISYTGLPDWMYVELFGFLSDGCRSKTAAEMEVVVMKKKIISFGIFTVVMIAVVLIFLIPSLNNAVAGERFSLEKNEKADGLSEEFLTNQIEADGITARFTEYLRKTYGVTMSDSVFTVNGLKSENYPPYYGGSYVNTDGYLVVQIAESYYTPDYRKSDWYQEFVGIVGSERFFCHPVKHSYSELIDAMSAIAGGDHSKGIVRPALTGIDDYENVVDVYYQDQKDYDQSIKGLDADLYSVSVLKEKLELHANTESGDPEAKPGSMTTEQVLDRCLEYENMLDLLAFDSFSQAIKTFISRDDRFRELNDREDGPEVVLQALRDYRPVRSDPNDYDGEFTRFYGRENFFFAMISYYRDEGRISEETFAEAEKIHQQNLEDHRAYVGQDTILFE